MTAASSDPQAWLADARAAAALLDGVARRTPVETSRALSESVGGAVHLKCENLQRAGSFKIRGAYVRIARLTDAERDDIMRALPGRGERIRAESLARGHGSLSTDAAS